MALPDSANTPLRLGVQDAGIGLVVHSISLLLVDLVGGLGMWRVWCEEAVFFSLSRSTVDVDDHVAWWVRRILLLDLLVQLSGLFLLGFFCSCCILGLFCFYLCIGDWMRSWGSVERSKLLRDLLNGELDSIGYSKIYGLVRGAIQVLWLGGTGGIWMIALCED